MPSAPRRRRPGRTAIDRINRPGRLAARTVVAGAPSRSAVEASLQEAERSDARLASRPRPPRPPAWTPASAWRPARRATRAGTCRAATVFQPHAATGGHAIRRLSRRASAGPLVIEAMVSGDGVALERAAAAIAEPRRPHSRGGAAPAPGAGRRHPLRGQHRGLPDLPRRSSPLGAYDGRGGTPRGRGARPAGLPARARRRLAGRPRARAGRPLGRARLRRSGRAPHAFPAQRRGPSGAAAVDRCRRPVVPERASAGPDGRSHGARARAPRRRARAALGCLGPGPPHPAERPRSPWRRRPG